MIRPVANRAADRRSLRMFDDANDRLGKSRSIVWCFDPAHMPALIYLLIAKGALSQSDAPHCVHWREARGAGELTEDEIGRVLDGDALLEEVGIPTIPRQAWKAWRQGPQPLEALWREWLGELTADDRKGLADLKANVGPATRRPD